MKKVLFATTALVASTGIASADIALSGWAEMGIFGGDGVETQFFQDIDVSFTMSGTTDNGLTFGASVDLDENTAFAPATHGGATVFISGDFGTLTMGDTDGALDWALTEAWVGNAGSIADDETAHAGAMGAYGDGFYDGQVLRYDYSVGDLGFALSVELDDTGVRDHGVAVGMRYGIDMGAADIDLGVGYQSAVAGAATTVAGVNIAGADVSILGLSGAVTLDVGLSLGVQYSAWEIGAAEAQHIGFGAGYTFDAITVSFNYGTFTSDDIAAVDGVSGLGLAAAYDLGGGLGLHMGYGASEDAAGNESSTWSLGLAMSF